VAPRNSIKLRIIARRRIPESSQGRERGPSLHGRVHRRALFLTRAARVVVGRRTKSLTLQKKLATHRVGLSDLRRAHVTLSFDLQIMHGTPRVTTSQGLSFRDPRKLAAWRGSDRLVGLSHTGNRRLRRPIVPSAPIFLCAGHRTVRGSRRCLAAGTHMAGDSMSKKQRLVEYSFRPALIVAMREAFQKACEAPQVADGAPGVTEGVARRILELAKAGETSPDRLCSGALRKLSH